MKRKEKIGALILAAGKGNRFGTETPKQFLLLDEVPMFLYSVDVFLPLVDKLILVTAEEEIERAKALLDDAGLLSSVDVAAGGRERYESSVRGLEALDNSGKFDLVLIHDAARPLVTPEIVEAAIESARTFGAVAAGVPAKNTIKLVSPEGLVLDTPDRKACFEIQTPQAFRVPLLRDAYEKAAAEDGLQSVTDDASVVERFTDHLVRISPGSEENLKVTTPFDWTVAETLLIARRLKREAEQ